tara:strand:- start:749 stop:1240 length:492 start_codon:yes stop_codon:yes gene_type:complete
MNKKVIYPGSFDPLTNGHLDIIKRASKMFDHIVVAVVENNSKKEFLFNTSERKKMIQDSVVSLSNVSVESFDGLLIDFAVKQNSNTIIRGLRVLSDFEYEFRMALMNRKLNDQINTIFMMPNEKYTHIGSSLIKEVGLLGGKIDDYIPDPILSSVKNKINEKK